MIDRDLLIRRLSYDPDTGRFTWTERVARNVDAGRTAGSKNRRGYVRLRIDRVNYMAHRLAWFYVFGVWPQGLIDHINGDPCDNRIANLRDVDNKTNVQNQRRAHRTNRSCGLIGVTPDRDGQWRARIHADGKRIHLGIFPTAEQAHSAYVLAKRTLHEGCTL